MDTNDISNIKPLSFHPYHWLQNETQADPVTLQIHTHTHTHAQTGVLTQVSHTPATVCGG